MKRYCGLLVFFCLFAGLMVRAQEFKAAYPGRGVTTIAGDWRFHTGDDMGWVQPGLDDRTWETIKADQPWGSQSHPGYSGFAWYRDAIEIDGVKGPVSILMPYVQDAYELYWNGERIGGSGQLPPGAQWHPFALRNVFALPKPDGNGTLKGVLAVRVWKAQLSSVDSADVGGMIAAPQIGDSKILAGNLDAADAVSQRTRLVRIVECFLMLVIGVLSIGLWVLDRRKMLNLWLGLFLFATSLSGTLGFPEISRASNFEWNQFKVQLQDSTADLAIWMIVLTLFGLDKSRSWRRATAVMAAIYLGAQAVDISAIWFWSSGWTGLQVIDGVATAVYSVAPLYLFVLLVAGVFRNRDLALLPLGLACVALETYNVVTGGLGQGSRFTHVNFPALISAAAIHLGPHYTLSLRDQIIAVMLVVMVWTVLRQQALDRKQQISLEAEVKSAKEVQQVLVPEAMEPVAGFAISSLYWPAEEVGGDLFQVLPGRDGDLVVVLADVSGKGLKAAMTVSVMVGAIRTLIEYTTDPLEILNGLNRRLMGRTNGGFATCLVLHVRADGEVTMGNAGHLAPYLNGEEMSVPGSLPLGVAREAEFEESRFVLHENDEVTLYTDGVLEAQAKSGELYGFDRTKALMRGRPSVQAIAEAAKSFGQKDDVTLVKIMRVHEADARPRMSVDLQTVEMTGREVVV